MIHFKFTFLLAFKLPKESSKKEKNNGKRGSGEKKGKGDKKGRKNSLTPSKAVVLAVEKPRYVIEGGKLAANFKLNYELIPKKLSYDAEVTCYRNVAKITTRDGTQFFRTIIQEDIAWVPFSVQHYTNSFCDEDVYNICNHTVIFTFTNTTASKQQKKEPKKGGSKGDDTGFRFYCHENEVDNTGFIEVFESNPNVGQHLAKNNALKTIEFNVALERGCASCLRLTSKRHIFMLHDTISRIIKGQPVKFRQFIPHEESLSDILKQAAAADKGKAAKKGKGKNGKGGKNGKKGKGAKKDSNVIIRVPGEVFIADPYMSTYRIEEATSTLLDGYVFVSAGDLLSREQKTELNPLVINVLKLNRFPCEFLKSHGFEKVYITYTIPQITKYNTIIKPVDHTVSFNDCKVYFTNILPRCKMLEYLLSRQVVMEIIGIKTSSPSTELPQLFGKNTEDRRISDLIPPEKCDKYLPKKTEPQVTLAVANFNVSSILKNVWFFKEKAQCHSPNTTIYNTSRSPVDKLQMTDLMTVGEQNLGVAYNKVLSPLGEGILTKMMSTLEIEIYFMVPQYPTLYLQSMPDSYRRLFVVLFQKELAKALLIQIQHHNRVIASPPAESAPSKKSSSPPKDSKQSPPSKGSKSQESEGEGHTPSIYTTEQVAQERPPDMLTGFVIDNGNSFAFFIEGLSFGYILSILHQVYVVHRKRARVFTNTEHVFEERIYKDFMDIGMYVITFKQEFQDMFSRHPMYLSGNVPTPCWEAMKKLNMLFQSDSFQQMMQFDLFPKPDELISLNLEYGVPLMWVNRNVQYELN